MSDTGFDLSSIPPEALSSAIAKLTENPEILSTVASAIGVGASDGGEQPPSIMATLAPMLSGFGGKKSPEEERRDALLCALKPYMSPRRREMIEYMLKFGKFGDVLKKLK